MSEHKIPIPSMIYNAAVGGHVTNSQQIIDENLNREQNDINQETVGAVPYNSTTPNLKYPSFFICSKIDK